MKTYIVIHEDKSIEKVFANSSLAIGCNDDTVIEIFHLTSAKKLIKAIKKAIHSKGRKEMYE